MANASAHGRDTREHTTREDILSTVSHLRAAVDDYSRMQETLKTASPVIARHVRKDMRLQRRVIRALVAKLKEEVDDGEL